MHLGRFVRRLVGWVAVAALLGCANLQAVRDFTATSAQLTGYTAVTERYVSSPGRTLAQIPEGSDFDADRALTRKEAADVAAAKDSIVKLHNAATGYMAALAKLAGDNAFNVSLQIDKVTVALVASPSLGLDASHVKAFSSIASDVTS